MNFAQIIKTGMVFAFICVISVACGGGNPQETLRGEADLVDDAVAIVQKINSVSNGWVTLDTASFGQMASLIIELGIDKYLFTDQNPDVRILEVEGEWVALPTTKGYAPAVVRFGTTRSGKKSVRAVEIHKRWATEIPEYFVDQGKSTRIAVAGHMRWLMDGHGDIFELLADAINAQKPDYLYLLGDIIVSNSDDEYDLLEARFLNKLVAPYVYVLGNHESREIHGGDAAFLNRIGEPKIVVNTDTVNIVAIDSSDPLDEVLEVLAAARKQVDPEKLTLLMTHHKIWKKRKSTPYGPYFTNTEFMPHINTWVDVIIDGDIDRKIEKTSLNNGTIDAAYSVGMHKKATNTDIYFAMVSVSEGPDQVLQVIPNYIDLDIAHPYYIMP